jgi:hypothetical protein
MEGKLLVKVRTSYENYEKISHNNLFYFFSLTGYQTLNFMYCVISICSNPL